ncbi:MAG: ribosome biogenesis protein [Thermoplasmata archaeon M11B2D]|nr:MAG: ribosome biogenesis protein [Thermoplasmata archaeon M11B2D]PNX53423.1 MAG: ribosome biogenesis protein [Thermoplasmata archaeon M9B2D]
MSEILYCMSCQRYTLHQICRSCKEKTISKKPARFSPQDHYGKYRRALKKREIRKN